MKETQPIDATSYRRLIDGLLGTLENLIVQNDKMLRMLEESNLKDSVVYGVGIGKQQTYKVLQDRILEDLETLQQEANEFEGLDA